MKTFKKATIMSGVIFLLLSVICFISTIGYDIDAYDFGNIYKSLNPAKVFLLFAAIVFIGMLVLKRRKSDSISTEKLFLYLIVIIFACFGCAYLSSTDKNTNVFFQEIGYSELGHNLNKQYLPYYDEYSDSPEEKGEYEIYKGESNGTVMIYVDSDIINTQGRIDYEAEYLDTKNMLIYYKYLLSKTIDDVDFSLLLKGTQNTYNINGLKLDLYQNGTEYTVIIRNDGKIFFVTLTNVLDILPEDFARKCAEQFDLMKKTVDNGRLLVL